MSVNDIVSRFLESPKAVALGPSSLESLANGELWPNDSATVVVPDNLLRLVTLISEGSNEHRDFLIRLVRYFRSRTWSSRYREDEEDHYLANRIANLILEFKQTNRLLVIGEGMIDEEIQESLGRLYPGGAFEISLSPKKNFLREYLVRIYSWSKHTGGVILERTRRVFSDLGHHIATLQLPDKLDHYVGLKSQYIGRTFGFRGGRATKFFVGVAVGLAGLGNPAASVAGVVIAFMDP